MSHFQSTTSLVACGCVQASKGRSIHSLFCPPIWGGQRQKIMGGAITDGWPFYPPFSEGLGGGNCNIAPPYGGALDLKSAPPKVWRGKIILGEHSRQNGGAIVCIALPLWRGNRSKLAFLRQFWQNWRKLLIERFCPSISTPWGGQKWSCAPPISQKWRGKNDHVPPHSRDPMGALDFARFFAPPSD